MKILIIEDDIQLNTTITNFLKYKGHETTSVEDGEDALEYIDKNFYNLFIIDINIPIWFRNFKIYYTKRFKNTCYNNNCFFRVRKFKSSI